MRTNMIWSLGLACAVLMSSAAMGYADCGYITWSETTDSPPGGEDFRANNEPTQFCALGFPNLSPSEEGGLRTCMGVSYPCGEFWLDLDITSYATDAEARGVWDAFIGDDSVQKILANDFGSLLDSGPDWFLVMGGTYLYPETYDYGFLNLYALHQGCIVGIKRTRISAASTTPQLSTAQACWNGAFAFAKDLIDRKCGVQAENHPPQILIGPMDFVPFASPYSAQNTSSFWIAFLDFDGVEDLNFNSFRVTREGIDVTANFMSKLCDLYAAGKVSSEEAPEGALKVWFNGLWYYELDMLLDTAPTDPLVNLCLADITFTISDYSGAQALQRAVFRRDENKPRALLLPALGQCNDSDPLCDISGNSVFLEVYGCSGWADLDWTTFRVTRNGEDITSKFIDEMVTLLLQGKMFIDLWDPLGTGTSDYWLQFKGSYDSRLTPADLRALLHFFQYGDAAVEVSISDRNGVSGTASALWTFGP